MSYDLQSLTEAIILGLKNFYNSPFVFAIKILLGIYVAVLIVDIILLLVLRGVGSNIRTGLRGMDIPVTTPSKMKKKWDKITARLADDNVSQYKVAIIEADALADELLEKIGYKGNNMSERLENIRPEQLDVLDDLKQVHEVRNRIVHEANFQMTRQQAKEVIDVYENFLRYLEFLD
jgi:hypothetical protein